MLFAGYQAAGTRGAALLRGAREIRIHGQQHKVRAEVTQVSGLSAHADYRELIEWLRPASAPSRCFVTHGDLAASSALHASLACQPSSPAHVVIDIPVGATAKVRSAAAAQELQAQLTSVSRQLGLDVVVEITDGTQPVGRGIGPALEARDVLAVLSGEPDAPADLRERAARLAGRLLELSGAVSAGGGYARASELLDDGGAWRKFQAIGEAQGGPREPPSADHRHEVVASRSGFVRTIDNRRLARVAKLAGAPGAKAAGVDLTIVLGQHVESGEPLFEIHAETPGELAYALHYLAARNDIIEIADV